MAKVKLKNVRVRFNSMLVASKPPDAPADQKKKYSAGFFIPKKSKALVELILDGIDAALEEKFHKVFKLKGDNNPLHDGDDKYGEDEEKYAHYKGMWYINASNMQPPSIILEDGTEVDGPDDENASEIYSGVWGNASINLSAYDHKTGGKGVGIYLNAFMKTKDDEALGSGRVNASDEFAEELGKKPKKKKVEDDDEDDEPAPRKRGVISKRKRVDPEDDFEGEDDDEDDEPAPRKRKKVEDDDEDDEPAPRKRRAR